MVQVNLNMGMERGGGQVPLSAIQDAHKRAREAGFDISTVIRVRATQQEGIVTSFNRLATPGKHRTGDQAALVIELDNGEVRLASEAELEKL
jgi:hypothetical protein